MVSVAKMQAVLGMILLIGILISVGLVIVGGSLYLLQYGNENMHREFLQADTYQTNIKQIWDTATVFSPLSLIELGLLTLVATQVLRVALLTGFYTLMRDYWFTLFSFFILMVLVYSFIWRN